MKSKSHEFADRLASDYVYVADGAMGTMLYAKGIFINRCFDELNLSAPDLVKEIHQEYVAAGAEIIETNTYGANRFKLRPHGFEEKLRDINIAAARLAREVATDRALVAGSMGPLAPSPLKAMAQRRAEDVYDAFHEQVEALAEGGVDLLIIETISDLDELRLAIKACKDVCDLPIIASVTHNEDNKTVFGDTPEECAAGIEQWGADVAGVNCSTGPRAMLASLQRMGAVTKLPFSAMPNAGSPQLVDGRYIYLSSPEYMAEYAKRFIQRAGVSIIGGCCGTTPAHIKAIRSAVRALRPSRIAISIEAPSLDDRPPAEEPVETSLKSPLARKLRRKFVTSIELTPPRSPDPAKALKSAAMLKEYGVDCVNIPDGPRASARISPMVLAWLVEHEVGMETILHYTCRDRNILGMQSDLQGAHALGLRNVLAVTGDPPKIGDYPDATAVFDIDAIGLVRMIYRLNCGQDLVGNPIGSQTAFHVGVGANPGAINIEKELERYGRKVEAGAEYVLTQPVFDVRLLESFLANTRESRLPTMVGILPLLSHRNAEFLHNEVPGMQIPDVVMKRMAKISGDEAARREGILIAREAIAEARTLEGVSGVYIMPPFGRYPMALEVLEAI
ncbi:MAG TPA: bifunctional homocysteine S-methyltransferase/methylenetetrahydrofolate reductase [Acidobacteriota bacterium]|nr:bifunctional homocysteine S-methyltransferase/methylenetetrahydrofolate reductase [Acidobacteriota bacterium]